MQYKLLILALIVWLPVIYLLQRWSQVNPLRQALTKALVAGLLFALTTIFVGTNPIFDDWASGREGMILLVYGAIHLIPIGLVVRRHPVTYAALFTLFMVWIEVSATILLLAAWSLFKFGYF